MFQAEPIAWLQIFASPALTWVMSAITILGYTPVYIALVLVLVFGFRLRPSLGVLLALLLSGILTEGLKSALALPRPSDIDARVVEPTDGSHVPLVARGSAPGFWELPTTEAIAAVRAQPGARYGFPSGHVSSAAAFLFGIALFFRSRRILIVAVVWPLLMGLSRMYLGQHFLADVFGGLAVGVLGAGAAALLLRGLDRETVAARTAMPLLPVAVVVLLLVVLTPWVPPMNPENVGRLTGFVAAYAVLLLATGFPSDHGTIPQRCGRVISTALVYLGIGRVINMVVDATGWEGERLAALAAAALITAGTLLGGIAIARRLRWYVAG